MLLKPLYDIRVPENMFLRFIEIGAYKPISRKLIELNIPRETAIYLSENYFKNTKIRDEDSNESIINQVRKIHKTLDYWRQVQLESIV